MWIILADIQTQVSSYNKTPNDVSKHFLSYISSEDKNYKVWGREYFIVKVTAANALVGEKNIAEINNAYGKLISAETTRLPFLRLHHDHNINLNVNSSFYNGMVDGGVKWFDNENVDFEIVFGRE